MINVVIKPVGVKKVRVSTPLANRLLCVVVVGEVIFGDVGVYSCVDVADIFLLQRINVIFGVTRNKYLSAVIGCKGLNARRLGHCYHAKLLNPFAVLKSYLGVS